jgi:hypothetical protein
MTQGKPGRPCHRIVVRHRKDISLRLLQEGYTVYGVARMSDIEAVRAWQK